MTYKNSNVLEVIFKISIDSTQRGPIKSESVDANLLKSAYSAQLLEIHGFHFQENGRLCPTDVDHREQRLRYRIPGLMGAVPNDDMLLMPAAWCSTTCRLVQHPPLTRR